MTVLGEWEKVWEAAGRPGPLGGSKAENVRLQIERDQAVLDAAERLGDLADLLGLDYYARCGDTERAVVDAVRARREAQPMVTKSGRVLTDADVQALADEAERGYDVDKLRRRRLRERR